MSAHHPTDPAEELATRIREAMLQQRITEAELERMVHREVLHATITGIINANLECDWTAVRTIAQELGCDIDHLANLWAATGAPVTAPPTFGDRLRGRRQELGLSQRRLAARVGVSKTAYVWYELDRSLPQAARVPALAKALRIPTSRLGRWLNDSPLASQGGSSTH